MSDGSLWKLPLGQMLKHQDQVESDIPELGRTVLADFKKRIQFYLLVAAFRRSAFVVHGLPFIAATRRGCVEADVGFHRNRACSAKPGVGARLFTGADAVVV